MESYQNEADLILRHGQIITMDNERRIIQDGAIAIRRGRIMVIGPDKEVASLTRSAQERDLQGALVHPGFVDAHVHLIYHLSRGMVPDFYTRNRIWEEIELPLISAITPEDEYLSTLLACMEMVSNGTTAFADAGCAFSLDAMAEAAQQVGLRGIIGTHLEDIDRDIPKFYQSTDQCLETLKDQITRYPRGEDLSIWGGANLVGMGRASNTLLKETKELADRHRVPMIMHQSYDEREVADSISKYGKRPIEHLADLGILGTNLVLVRMIQLDDEEIALTANSGTCVVHCPAASTKHGVGVSHIGHVPDMLQAGIPVALGSDSPNWANAFDVAHHAYLAATIHREAKREVPTIPACTALEMATLYGARAMGIEDEIGSLEVGKRADLVIHTLNKPEAHPPFDPVSNLIYTMRSKTVETVIVEGKVIMDAGKFLRVDARDIYARVDKAARHLAERMDMAPQSGWSGISDS